MEDNETQDFSNDDEANPLYSQVPLPPPTDWRNICTFCGIQLNYIPKIHKYFLNHWKIQLFFPIVVLTLISCSYFLILRQYIFPYAKWLSSTLSIFIGFAYFIYILSYIVCIYVGPGYLPFYYPLKINRYEIHDHLSGYVTRSDQFEYVQQQKYPTRVEFFNMTDRLVIRPDHFCGWTSTFIGRRNHKIFFIFNLWGIIYMTLELYCIFRGISSVISIYENKGKKLPIILTISFAIASLIFYFMTASIVVGNVYRISINKTQIEEMKERNKKKIIPNYGKGSCIKNWEEIFGSRKKWYLWLWPIPVFSDVDDYALPFYGINDEQDKLL